MSLSTHLLHSHLYYLCVACGPVLIMHRVPSHDPVWIAWALVCSASPLVVCRDVFTRLGCWSLSYSRPSRECPQSTGKSGHADSAQTETAEQAKKAVASARFYTEVCSPFTSPRLLPIIFRVLWPRIYLHTPSPYPSKPLTQHRAAIDPTHPSRCISV
jgi:hypothetical protein